MEEWLLQMYGAKSLDELDPWAPFRENRVEIWEPAREVTINVDFKGPGQSFVPTECLEQPRNLFQGQPAHLDLVCVTQFFARNLKSAKNANYYVQTNFVPKVYQKAQEEQDRLHEAAGVIPRVVMQVPENKNESILMKFHASAPGDAYLNLGFSKTAAFLNNQNLVHGIVKIPEEFRSLFPKEAKVQDSTGNARTFEINDFFLVPHNHVLAWRLNVESSWRYRKGLYAENISSKTGSKLLFFAVADETLFELILWTQNNWMNKVDLRPLQSIGFHFIPTRDDQVGAVELRCKLSYLCWPSMTKEQLDNLLPVLHEGTLPYSQVLIREIEMEKRINAQK